MCAQQRFKSVFTSAQSDQSLNVPTEETREQVMLLLACVMLSLSVVGNPNRKKMHIFGFVGIFEYIC